jgi:hypothetical protein
MIKYTGDDLKVVYDFLGSERVGGSNATGLDVGGAMMRLFVRSLSSWKKFAQVGVGTSVETGSVLSTGCANSHVPGL